jgi:hypothetical protein
MDRDTFMRRALAISVVYNLGGALLFAFPSSLVGRLAGFPILVAPIYSTLLAFFVTLFAGAYAWLARQPYIDRPLVAFSAIGKAGAFSVILVFWLFGQGSGRGVVAAVGDLVLAGIFVWWLLGAQEDGRGPEQSDLFARAGRPS